MKSTQKKKSKTWNSMMQTRRMKGSKGFFRPPTWATTYKLTTTKESNSQNHWYGWIVEFDKYLTNDNAKTLEITREFYNNAKAMDIFCKVDYSSSDINQETKKTATPF